MLCELHCATVELASSQGGEGAYVSALMTTVCGAFYQSFPLLWVLQWYDVTVIITNYPAAAATAAADCE